MSGQLSYRYRVESEIGDDGEYREIVVDLGVEAISSDIEISSEHLDEQYRDQSSDDLACDLGDGIGVDFFGRHMSEEYMIKIQIYEQKQKNLLTNLYL
jgi:hypothetical protein